MRSVNKKRVNLMLCGLVVAVMALAQPAFASGGVTGEDLLTAKDDVQQTLQLEDTTLQISTLTRIYNADERQISFRQIPNPEPESVLVKYEGQADGDLVLATKVYIQIATN